MTRPASRRVARPGSAQLTILIIVCLPALLQGQTWQPCTSGGGSCLPSGNAGIGTTAPATPLQLAGGEDATRISQDDGNDYTEIAQRAYGASAGILFNAFKTPNGSSVAGDLFTTGNTQYKRSAGIMAAAGIGVYLNEPGGGIVSIYSAPPGAANASVVWNRMAWLAGGYAVSFSPRGNASDFWINGSGNVGIGTQSPTYPLSVNGAVQAKEVIVNTGWSDYVFAPDYRLTPLEDVAAYVRKNHHLPEIPSAREVEEKGVSLGEMQSKLLAKIEELTLHMIEAEKRVTGLAQAVDDLKRENSELRAQSQAMRETYSK